MRKETRNHPTPVAQGGDIRQDRAADCLLRLFWMAFGNLGLLLLALLIFEGDAFSALDGVYWGIVVALGGARYLDIARFDGLTASGEPATRGHFRRYMLGLSGGAAALWGGAHVLRLFS